jgi:zinc protease
MVPTETELKTTLDAAEATAVTPWHDTTSTRELIEHKPEPAAIASTRKVDEVGLTVVRFANGVEAWLKPTDFKNDQIVFALQARGGTSLAPSSDYVEASLSTAYVNLSGAAGLKALDMQKLLAGKLAGATPFALLSTHGFNGSSCFMRASRSRATIRKPSSCSSGSSAPSSSIASTIPRPSSVTRSRK